MTASQSCAALRSEAGSETSPTTFSWACGTFLGERTIARTVKPSLASRSTVVFPTKPEAPVTSKRRGMALLRRRLPLLAAANPCHRIDGFHHLDRNSEDDGIGCRRTEPIDGLQRAQLHRTGTLGHRRRCSRQ